MKHIKGKHALVAMVALALGPALTMPAEGQELRGQFRSVKTSVVVVRTLERGLPVTSGRKPVSAPGLGSGVLVSADGKVLTAAHVVQTADLVAVEFADGTIVPAKVMASIPRADVALLQLQRVPSGVEAASIGNSDSLQVGDDVFIVGAPYGLSHTLSAGHVSGRHSFGKTIEGVGIEVLQTDAAVNTGNSGGPMFDMQGRVVGIVSSILTRSGGFEGVGFAVTSNVARALMLARPSFWTGVDAVLLADTLAQAFNLPQGAGLLIQRVADGSPGAQVGLRGGTVPAMIDGEPCVLGGDIVLTVAGFPVADDEASIDRIQGALSRAKPGEQLVVTVLRAGKIVTLATVVRAM